ncbi:MULTISPECIES: hypothetical protein [unclassified Thalassospira]|uniref:hypothetical protein n=1 Tax=unclassified Thalassospira TaxID=2648997 RepID=UPI001B1D2F51|nr:hypothetical protein [Thalassospira sp.]MBO6771960.1 hypothetical protein [Thalassospira sp.]
MVDLGSLASALSSLNAASEIAKSIVGLRDANLMNEKIIEFQAKILEANSAALSAQTERMTLLETISELRKKVEEIEVWVNEESRYQLTDFGSQTYAYLLKPDMANGEPEHRLCASCFQKRVKSILQFQDTVLEQHVYLCPNCTGEFRFGRKVIPPITNAIGF